MRHCLWSYIGQLVHTGYSAAVNISHRGGEIPLDGISKLEMKMCGPTGTLSKKKKLKKTWHTFLSSYFTLPILSSSFIMRPDTLFWRISSFFPTVNLVRLCRVLFHVDGAADDMCESVY